MKQLNCFSEDFFYIFRLVFWLVWSVTNFNKTQNHLWHSWKFVSRSKKPHIASGFAFGVSSVYIFEPNYFSLKIVAWMQSMIGNLKAESHLSGNKKDTLKQRSFAPILEDLWLKTLVKNFIIALGIHLTAKPMPPIWSTGYL